VDTCSRSGCGAPALLKVELQARGLKFTAPICGGCKKALESRPKTARVDDSLFGRVFGPKGNG
jgi:hypothetical protein